MHAHSSHSIRLLKSPVAKLQIPSIFAGLAVENAVSIAELRPVAGNVY